jgi:4-amino-4-deoxy-L-arabinose transferase-like glycosyltransferase
MVLLVILPFLLMCAFWKRRLRTWSETFLSAAVAWGAFLIGLTELLSRFDLLTRGATAFGWLIVSVLVCLATRFLPQRDQVRPAAHDVISRFVKIFLFVVAGILAIQAWIGPPNSWDAMTYHLPRVLHWIQDRNVNYYPVQFLPIDASRNWYYGSQQIRQLTMAPGAEYAVLNLQLVSGGERFSSLVQWFAYVGCLIGVWSIAELLGARPRACALAALFAGTLPMACLQAVSTQNDLVCAFWTICFVRLLIRLGTIRANGFDTLLCGLSLGLALVTKATAYVYLGPFFAGWLLILILHRQWKSLFRLIPIAVLGLLLNIPTYCRNYNFNGTLLGHSDVDLPYANASINVGYTVSNVLRNIALELTGPKDSESRGAERAARWLHRVLGLDADNPETTFVFTPFHFDGIHWTQEDHAPSPQHLILILLALITLRRANWKVWFHFLATAAAFLGFCAYLRWQPFHARLHMALFMLAAPCVGIALDQWKRRLLAIPVATLSVAAMACIVLNVYHPLLRSRNIFNTDQDTRRFIERLDLLIPFQQAASQIIQANPAEVGIDPGLGDDWEYPLEMMVKEKEPNVRFENLPGPWLIRPATENQGFDPRLKPYVIVRFVLGVPTVDRVE